MNIYEKLIEVRKSVPYLQKSADGPQFKYVSSSQVLANVKAKMDELGLLLIPSITSHKVTESVVEYTDKDKYGNEKPKKTSTYFTELDMDMAWINAEKPEETVVSPWYGQGVDIAGEKGVGKALTYGEKYFMLKFFNIPTDKDDPDSFQRKIDDEPEPKPEPKKGTPKPEPKVEPKPGPEPKPTQIQLKAIGTFAQRKGIDLSLKGVGWTHKANSGLWTMTDYCKVEKELEKLEDKK